MNTLRFEYPKQNLEVLDKYTFKGLTPWRGFFTSKERLHNEKVLSKVLEGKRWVTADNDVIPVDGLSEIRLKNILNVVLTNYNRTK